VGGREFRWWECWLRWRSGSVLRGDSRDVISMVTVVLDVLVCNDERQMIAGS
jgi:hypothetical protein